MKHLLLGYERGNHRIRAMKTALEELGQSVTIVTTNFEEVTEKHDRIWTLSESLLPIQAKYDELWNINDMSTTAANTLTNKKAFDDFCIDVGLGEIIPKSVIPLSVEDIFDGQVIIKPTIGSGTKLDGLSYTSYYSKEELLANLDENFFEINKTGFINTKFNNCLTHYMVQEKLPFESNIWCPYSYIDESKARILFLIRGRQQRVIKNNNQFLDHPSSFMVVEEEDVPSKVIEYADVLFNHVQESLKVRNIFFSGPDFFDHEGKVKFIDCNPRIGQGVQLTNDLQPGFISKIMSGEQVKVKNKWLWHVANLKPGRIKNIADYSHLNQYIVQETSRKLTKGRVITEQSNLSDSTFNFNFIVTGKDEPDMYNTYRAVQTEFQNLIEYC